MTRFQNIDHVERFGAPVFELRDAYADESVRCEIDLDEQVTDAVFATGRGEPFSQMLSYLRDVDRFGQEATHPAADKVRAALITLYTQGGPYTALSA